MKATQKCPTCGTALAEDMLGGQCPQCVARIALGPRIRYFGDYELLDEVGRGGMGVVYRARQISLNRVVAVKMLLHGDFASEEFVQRFHKEAEAAASLQHPNIVAIHEVGVHEGQPYFSMEYVEGHSLAEIARDLPLAPKRVARYVEEIAEAIHYAHRSGILHRDLKPSNILISTLDKPSITDFGLAKRLEDSKPSYLKSQLTLSGQVLGAPGYISPEQAAGKRERIGTAADVYALGTILYHLLTTRPPFLADSLPETLYQVQNQEPTPPRHWNPGVPRDLETICLKCLEKDPQRRYESAAALAADLRRWQAGEPILARPLKLLERTWRISRRHPGLVSLSLVVTLGLAGTAVLWPRPPPLVVPREVSELIYVVDNTEVPSRLCVTDPQGSFWHRLPICSSQVDVSPNGKQLCFLRGEGPTNSSLWVSRLDGRQQRRLVLSAGPPYWLDDRTVIYQSPDLVGLWVVDVDSRKTRKLFDWSGINTNYLVGGGMVSPDRKHLLLMPQNKTLKRSTGEFFLWAPTMDIYVCDPDGRNPRVVCTDPEGMENPALATTDTRAVWVGSDRVAWCRHARPGNRVPDMAIVSCRLGETNFQALTPWKGFNYPVAGSPDGKQLLFATEDAPGAGNLELWTMNLDGTKRRKVLERKFGCDLSILGRWVKRPDYL